MSPEKIQQHKLKIGVGILFILLCFMLYLWLSITPEPTQSAALTPVRPTAAENNEPESTKAEAEAEIINVMSTSDSLPAIEADLSATMIDALDTELNAIEAELNPH